MINNIINDIIKQIKPLLPAGTQLILEQDTQKSPFVSIWIANTDVEDSHEIIYTNWIIREPKGNFGSLSRALNRALLQFQQIEKTDYSIFGIAIPQGINKLGFTTDNKDTESLLSVKVFYHVN